MILAYAASVMAASLAYAVLSQYYWGSPWCLILYILVLALASGALLLWDTRRKKRLAIRLNALIDKGAAGGEYREGELNQLEHRLYELARSYGAAAQKSRAEGEKLNALVSDIAHQVKTPLSSIIMYAEMQTELKDKVPPHGDRILIQARKLHFLFEALIKISRCEGGLIASQLNRAPNSVRELVTKALNGVYVLAERKSIEISVDSAYAGNALFDMKWTCEALLNILDNAVKYTPEGGAVRLSITAHTFYTCVSVADNGCGINETEIQSIFKRFYRGKKASGDEGLGIGLYLSSGIMEAQGGYITAKSRPGEGSAFNMYLPLRDPSLTQK